MRRMYYRNLRMVVGALMESSLYLTMRLTERKDLVKRVYYMMFNM